MAIVHRTLEQAKATARFDRAKIEATTEEDIRRHMVEDGFDPDNPFEGLREVVSVETVRRRTGLSQERLATALRIPLATLRDWEGNRVTPDAVASAFLALVAADPDRAMAILADEVPAAE